jgi:hypothetical protein
LRTTVTRTKASPRTIPATSFIAASAGRSAPARPGQSARRLAPPPASGAASRTRRPAKPQGQSSDRPGTVQAAHSPGVPPPGAAAVMRIPLPNDSKWKDLPRPLPATVQPLDAASQGCSAIQASKPPKPPQSRSR